MSLPCWTAYWRSTAKRPRNELSTVKHYILEEVKKTNFVAIQADGTTDISTHCPMVLMLRYIDIHTNVQERFYEFIPIHNATADTISTALLERLSTVLPEGQVTRLIAQAYDGAAVMRGATGAVQRKVKDVYRNSHCEHCYAHQLDFVMQQAAGNIPHPQNWSFLFRPGWIFCILFPVIQSNYCA